MGSVHRLRPCDAGIPADRVPELVELLEARVGKNVGTDSSPSGIVRTISVPGLVLHGTGDEFVPLEHASRLHSNWTRSTLELLPGARHFAILRSAEVQKLVSGHLQEAR